MDTLTRYRQLTERLLTEHTRIPYSHGDLQLQTVFDRSSDHYLVIVLGRDQGRRIHHCLAHIDIIDGKLWVQRDGTEYGIAKELLDAGVPREDIVLGFRSPQMREEIADAAREPPSHAEAS
jgi:hypothetical protein